MYKISPNIILEITRDGMEGYITLVEPETPILENEKTHENTENVKMNVEELFNKIKDIVKIGLKEDELKLLLSNQYYNEKVCIAEGIKPIDGKDGYIKYHFDIDKKLAPKLLENDTVDYRELGIINNVRKGDILAELIPPTEGRNGYKVTGELIPYKKGKTPRFKYGKNVKLLDNGMYLVSKTDGLVELKDGRVIVSEVFEVADVDNKVGNINFNGSVIVRGNVLNGFRVIADGDVKVKGVVEGAYIENTGDVIVERGIQGYNRFTINTKGNVITKFVENAKLDVGRSITAEAIMHSEVSCKDSIIALGKRGLIVGGICRAEKEIRANIVGSSMATTTILEVGVDPHIRTRKEELKNNMDVIEENLNKVAKSLVLLDNLKKTTRLDDDKVQMYIKLLKTKESLLEELNRLKNEYETIEVNIENAKKGRIKVAEIVYPGVRIVIGNSAFYVRDVMKRCTFYRDEGEIKVGPY